MLGNSSSALVEAPAVDLPAVDVGDRQAGRAARRTSSTPPPTPTRSRTPSAGRSTRRSGHASQPPGRELADGRAGARIADIIAAWRPPDPPRKPPIRAAGRDGPAAGRHRRRRACAGRRSRPPAAGRTSGTSRARGRIRRSRLRPSESAAHLGDDDAARRRSRTTPTTPRPGPRLRRRRGPGARRRRSRASGPRRPLGDARPRHGDGSRPAPSSAPGAGRARRRRRQRRRARRSPRDRQHRRGRRARRRASATSATSARGAAVGGGRGSARDVFDRPRRPVRDHVTIGDGATIGMGAVVVSDVRGRPTVVGVPARRCRSAGSAP